MSSLSKKYIIAYNLAQAIGWTVALVQLVQGTRKRKSFLDAYDVGGALICKPSINCKRIVNIWALICIMYAGDLPFP